MAEITCRSCRCAPVAAEGLCVVCLRDKLQTDRELRHQQERRQRRGRHREPGKLGTNRESSLVERRRP